MFDETPLVTIHAKTRTDTGTPDFMMADKYDKAGSYLKKNQKVQLRSERKLSRQDDQTFDQP
jgi:hypothetical protein